MIDSNIISYNIKFNKQ